MEQGLWEYRIAGISFSFFLFFFFWGRLALITSAANPPLFAEEDWPWDNIHAHFPLFYMWDAYYSMACQAAPCPHLGFEPANPGPPRSGMCELNRCTGGRPPMYFFNSTWSQKHGLSIYTDFSFSQTLAVCSILEENLTLVDIPTAGGVIYGQRRFQR